MFQPLYLFVGLRYARARSHRFFVSFITWVSLLGVGVGVAALIVILSVMNGLGGELRSRLLSLSAPVRMDPLPGATPVWNPLLAPLAAVAGVKSVERFAELQVLAVRQPEMLPLLLRAGDQGTTQQLAGMIVGGDLTEFAAGDTVVLGRQVAEQLGMVVGDALTLLVPTITGSDALPEARLREFRVIALFEAGIPDHDATLAFTSLDTLQALGAERSGATGIAVQLHDVLAAPQVAQQVRAVLQRRGVAGVRVQDWTQQHASYFRAIRIEKTMMALILLLVVAVAAFNIVAMLVMVVTDKRTDVAILRTLGASPREVAAVFVAQGLVIGWTGVAAGVAVGVFIARHAGAILDALDRGFGVRMFDPDVYLFSQVPSELHLHDVLLVALSALFVTVLATIYPAMRAAAISPAEALRYE